MNTVESLNAALQKIQREVPFNNFRRYLAAEKLDKNLPTELGGACVYQLKKLVKVLTDVEGDESYLEEKGGLHTALIKKEPTSGDRYYLDPFLLHKEAINLDDILRGRRPQTSNVYPRLITEKQATLEVRPSGGEFFSTTLYYSPFNPEEYVSFIFDLAQATQKHPPLTKQRLSGSRPPELVLRLLNEDFSTTTLGWDLSKQSFKIKKKGGGISSRTYPENGEAFDREKELICTRVGLPWENLKNTIFTALEICKSLPEEERRVF